MALIVDRATKDRRNVAQLSSADLPIRRTHALVIDTTACPSQGCLLRVECCRTVRQYGPGCGENVAVRAKRGSSRHILNQRRWSIPVPGGHELATVGR